MNTAPMPHCTGGSCAQGKRQCATPVACGLPHDEPDASTFGDAAWLPPVLWAAEIALIVGACWWLA